MDEIDALAGPVRASMTIGEVCKCGVVVAAQEALQVLTEQGLGLEKIVAQGQRHERDFRV